MLTGPAIVAPLLVASCAAVLELGKRLLASGAVNGNAYLTVSVLQLVAFLFPCAIYYMIKGKKLATPMLIAPLKAGHLIFTAFAFVMFMSGTMLIKYFAFVNGWADTGMSDYYGDMLSSEEANTAGIILSVIILPALCEEFLFRGVLLAEYRAYGSVNAILITALFFSMMHFSFDNFIIYFFAGIVLGFAASVTRSLTASVIIHAAANAMAILTDDAYIRLTVLKCGEFFVGFVLACLFMISLILCLSRLEYIYYRNSQTVKSPELPPRSSQKAAAVFFSPTAMITAVLFVILTIYL